MRQPGRALWARSWVQGAPWFRVRCEELVCSAASSGMASRPAGTKRAALTPAGHHKSSAPCGACWAPRCHPLPRVAAALCACGTAVLGCVAPARGGPWCAAPGVSARALCTLCPLLWALLQAACATCGVALPCRLAALKGPGR